jgi:hypothetical protein
MFDVKNCVKNIVILSLFTSNLPPFGLEDISAPYLLGELNMRDKPNEKLYQGQTGAIKSSKHFPIRPPPPHDGEA